MVNDIKGPTSANNAYFAQVDRSETVGFDSETLINFCTARLNELNSDITNKMNYQQRNREAKGFLNAAKTKYTANPNAKTEIITNTAKGIAMMEPGPERDAAIAALNHYRSTSCFNDGIPTQVTNENIQAYVDGSGDPSIKNDLAQKEVIDGDKGSKNHVTAEECKDLTDALEKGDASIGKNMEIDMTKLQYAIGQRGIALQITTQMMQKLAQGYEQIAQNIGK